MTIIEPILQKSSQLKKYDTFYLKILLTLFYLNGSATLLDEHYYPNFSEKKKMLRKTSLIIINASLKLLNMFCIR
jgi:hypothetical protein